MEGRDSSFITSRLKAINKITSILDMSQAGTLDFTTVCRIFVETLGYRSAWIVLTSDTGEHIAFHCHTAKVNADAPPCVVSSASVRNFVNEALVHSGEVLYNGDPMIDILSTSGMSYVGDLHSMTFKLHYNTMIYGILSVTLVGDYSILREEQIIVSDLVKTIAFFLYDMDSRERIIHLFKAIFETTGNATIVIDDDTTITYANREFEKLSGYAREQIENVMSFTDLVHKDDIPMMLEFHRLRRIDAARAPRNYEFRFVVRDGQVRNIYMTIDMVPHSRLSIGSFNDVTEKKTLESQVIRISEQERQQIGSDLHDGLGPHLVGIKFLLKLLIQKIEKNVMPDLAEAEEIYRLVDQAVEQTRSISRGLKPVDIQGDGLVFALSDLARSTSSIFSISCTLDADEGFSIGNNITATHLYYIVREAVNNAVKHARPRHIEISLRTEEHQSVIRIRDDGTGMNPYGEGTPGIGISIMKYRANIINAMLEIQSGKGGGTVVACVLPR